MRNLCLITGASGGIGGAIAQKLAQDGYKLILHYHSNAQAINQLIQKLPEGSIHATISADLSDRDGIHKFLSCLHPGVESVVFAHGSPLIELFQDTDENSMDQLLTSQVKAPWLVSKHLIPSMVQSKMGRIVLISSIWGEAGASMEVVYSSVKGAQNSFVKALGKELAPSGIAVNGILPGLIDTEMNKVFNLSEMNSLLDEIPANRAGTKEEVAHAVSFLIDVKTTYINGELIKITGGW